VVLQGVSISLGLHMIAQAGVNFNLNCNLRQSAIRNQSAIRIPNSAMTTIA
jgi:hypothetical protein